MSFQCRRESTEVHTESLALPARLGSVFSIGLNSVTWQLQPCTKSTYVSRWLCMCLEMYKIRYFLTVKYLMKYFVNISVFNEIFQNATSLCSTCFFLPQGATAHI